MAIIPWDEIFDAAFALSSKALELVRGGKSRKLSRAVQKATKQAFREMRDAGALSAQDFALAKQLASAYTSDELKRFLQKWNECKDKAGDSEGEQVRAARVVSCSCDLLRSMKQYNRLPRELQSLRERYGC